MNGLYWSVAVITAILRVNSAWRVIGLGGRSGGHTRGLMFRKRSNQAGIIFLELSLNWASLFQVYI